MKTEIYYPLELIQASLRNELSQAKSVLLSGQMRSIMVYCLCDMGNDQFLPLNRDYKPLGLIRRNFVEYEEFPFLFIPRDMIDFTLFWDNGVSFGRHGYYTFSDSTYPQDKKHFQRYRQIILGAFFGMKQYNNLETFKKFWGYKGNISKEEYKMNLGKFEVKTKKNADNP